MSNRSSSDPSALQHVSLAAKACMSSLLVESMVEAKPTVICTTEVCAKQSDAIPACYCFLTGWMRNICSVGAAIRSVILQDGAEM